MTSALTFPSPLAFNLAPNAPDSSAPLDARLLPVSFSRARTSPKNEPAANHLRVLTAAVAILRQGEDLLDALSDAQFTTRVPEVFNGCIGGHYRHCLDHFTSLLRAVGGDQVDYDHRARDPRIESEVRYALNVTRDLRARLNLLTEFDLAAAVTTRCEVSYEHGDSPGTASSFARELAYCIAHAIHHFALISVIARLQEIALPESFGVAPSTVAHLARQNYDQTTAR